MNMNEVEQLVKMANQIAENFSFHEDAIDRLTDHLQRFWAPSMRKSLSAYQKGGGSGLKPVVVAAIQRLEPD